MKDATELKGGIVPFLVSLLASQAASTLLDQKLSDAEQHQRNIAKAEAIRQEKEASKEREKQAKIDAIRNYNEEQSIRRIEQDAMSKIYTKQKELQQKAAVEDVKRAKQRSAVQKELEQSRSQLQTMKEQQDQQLSLQRKALESQRQLSKQEQTALGVANLESMKQRAIADVRKQFAAPVTTRRLPPSVSTALLTKRGRGYDNDVLAVLQSYYGVSLNEAKKLYKAHF
jgi:hypothetical protein